MRKVRNAIIFACVMVIAFDLMTIAFLAYCYRDWMWACMTIGVYPSIIIVLLLLPSINNK